MLDIEVTRKNVFRTGDKGKVEPVPVGTRLQFDGDEVPGYLKGKCRVITPEKSIMETGDKKPAKRGRPKADDTDTETGE